MYEDVASDPEVHLVVLLGGRDEWYAGDGETWDGSNCGGRVEKTLEVWKTLQDSGTIPVWDDSLHCILRSASSSPSALLRDFHVNNLLLFTGENAYLLAKTYGRSLDWFNSQLHASGCDLQKVLRGKPTRGREGRGVRERRREGRGGRRGRRKRRRGREGKESGGTRIHETEETRGASGIKTLLIHCRRPSSAAMSF
jgi:hypothetical protein